MAERNGPRFTVEQRKQLRVQALAMSQKGMSEQDIANHFDVSQGTINRWLHVARGVDPVARRHAQRIRAELVCCDIFEQMEALHGDLLAMQRLKEDRKKYHDICYYGEWAARIVERTA